ncbi:MAG: hypothetical protein KGM96_07260 [Acidobacteriota bacterium]|nr:hypothetical protein [Acidobacteriota bacterium]
MKSGWSILCGLGLVLVTGVPMWAATTPFAITATNVTMSPGSNPVSQFTVTGIPMTGTLTVACAFAGAASMASKAPICPMTPPRAPYQVNAGGTVQGVIAFYPPGGPIPAAAPVAGAALAGVLLLGLGFRRRGWNWLALVVLCVAFLAGMTACGGSSNGMTPGTYPYTISASNESGSTTPLGQQVTTTINVTVP